MEEYGVTVVKRRKRGHPAPVLSLSQTTDYTDEEYADFLNTLYGNPVSVNEI